MSSALPCPECGGTPEIQAEYVGYSVYCRNCYDPTPKDRESGPHYEFYGYGKSMNDAIDDWNESVVDE